MIDTSTGNEGTHCRWITANISTNKIVIAVMPMNNIYRLTDRSLQYALMMFFLIQTWFVLIQARAHVALEVPHDIIPAGLLAVDLKLTCPHYFWFARVLEKNIK